MSAFTTLTDASTAVAEPPSLDVTAVHRAHADFVWASLQRLGVRDGDLEDMLQEVFVVVYQRLHTFDQSSRMTTWLFGIALRVAAAYRRRAYVRREQPVGEVMSDDEPETGCDPEEAAQASQARSRLDAILDQLDLEKRAVFVMFEIDEMSCEEIGDLVGVPIGTVYSRLHAARGAFQKALARQQAKDARMAATRRGGDR